MHILIHYIYFCFYVLIVLRFIFIYSTVTGRKCEINIIVIVIVIVKKCAHSQESVVDKERPGRHQNNTAARSFLDNTFLTISKLITPSMYCWFHKTLVTMHWTQFKVNNGICAGFCPRKTNNRILLITGYFERQRCRI